MKINESSQILIFLILRGKKGKGTVVYTVVVALTFLDVSEPKN